MRRLQTRTHQERKTGGRGGLRFTQRDQKKLKLSASVYDERRQCEVTADDGGGRDRKFIVDAMLKNIVSWLRILGYDTVYWCGEDSGLLKLAKQDGRIIVTMDRELALSALKNGLESTLVMRNDASEVLAMLASKYGVSLDFDPGQTRCPLCNHVLKLSRVGKREEWTCPNCNKKYWRGSHWKNIVKVFDEAKRRLESTCEKQ